MCKSISKGQVILSQQEDLESTTNKQAHPATKEERKGIKGYQWPQIAGAGHHQQRRDKNLEMQEDTLANVIQHKSYGKMSNYSLVKFSPTNQALQSVTISAQH